MSVLEASADGLDRIPLATAPSRARDQGRLRLLIVLGTLTSLFNFLDRSVLNILAEPIKRELGLSDTQIGLLTGFAFALFYSAMGLPIARHVDRPATSRPTVVAACVALWSGMTMACGAVASYGQLLTARVLVAVGESGSGPAIVTLIDHYVPPSRRSRVFALYGLGIPLGTLIGLALGGWLVDSVGWRWTFLLVGAPGLLLAAAVRLLLHEPRRDRDRTQAEALQPSVRDNLLTVGRSPALRWLMAATALTGLFSVGLPSWTGIYLIRELGLSATHAGLTLGLIMGTAGGLGTFLGGILADRISAGDPGRALLVPCGGLLLGIPTAVLAFSTGDWRVFAGCYWFTILGATAYLGPTFSLLQLLVARPHRATTTVINTMCFNLIGAGLGPLLIGLASDLLKPSFGGEGLRWALLISQASAFIPAFCYYRAAATAGRQIESVAGSNE